MAWRIDEPLVRAELDNRVQGIVTGTLWFLGLDQPVILKLEGNAWRDLAGRFIRITNPTPKPGTLPMDSLALRQDGVVGDITASSKVKVPDVPMEEFIAGYKSGRTFTFHWANSLYLEWFSLRNGRVVIESADYTLEVVGEATWEMNEAEEIEQRKANEQAMTGFMDRMLGAFHAAHEPLADESDNKPTSEVEAEADAENARMNQLLDRISARLDREGHEGDNYERIMEEEREKLRIERGEPEPEPLTPEQEAERARWIEEVNKAAQEALEEMERNPPKEREDHPLVRACSDLGVRLYRETKRNRWTSENDSSEHPIQEIIFGVQNAGAKMAGALNRDEDEEWPPEPLFAGDTLVRLKKARTSLRDALSGLDSADEQQLADAKWRSQTRAEIKAILTQVEQLIREVRSGLE